MAYKIFRQFESPTQRDLQMLMDQSVIVCTSTTRPFAPHEGMFIYESDTNGYKWYNGTTWVSLSSAVDAWISGNNLSVPGNLSAGGTLTSTGDATVANLAAATLVTMAGSVVNRTVDGRAGGSVTTTAVAATSDTLITGANVQNTPVVATRAYLAFVQIDFNPITGTQGDSRIELKLWNGSVGGTQLGGTVRWMTGIPVGTGINRSCQCWFMWQAPSTTTISNINLSASKSHNTTNLWNAEVNSAYAAVVMEIGAASAITGI